MGGGDGRIGPLTPVGLPELDPVTRPRRIREPAREHLTAAMCSNPLVIGRAGLLAPQEGTADGHPVPRRGRSGRTAIHA